MCRSDLDALVAAAHERYRRARPRSAAAHERARQVLPGGNTRSVLHFEPFPFRVAEARGSRLTDIDGHSYIDFCGNYTAGLLGHDPEGVRRAIHRALESGWAVGATHPREVELAERICARFPNIDAVRFTNSGTEANLMAIGTALHHTGRTGVGVFDHGYHGGVLSFGDLDGPHNPLNVPHRFVVAPYDDETGLDALFADTDLGCVLIEAVQGSGGCRPATVEFLTELRRRCDDSGTLLILDEVMTSRLAPGGVQELYGLRADLTTLGKYLGGGMTFGAFGGRAEIMAHFDPGAGGSLTQAGTFNNNVVTMAAAVAALDRELTPERIAAVNALGDDLRAALVAVFEDSTLPLWITGLGSMNCIHSDEPRLSELLFHHLLDHGIYIARRGLLALSVEITEADVTTLVETVEEWTRTVAGR